MRRRPTRDTRGPLSIAAEQLTSNPDGLRRLCASVGVPSEGTPYEVACRYLRWCKRNPQPRVDRR